MSYTPAEQTGSQRLSIKRLREWEALGFGMFIHFGMSTFTGSEAPDGSQSADLYAPERLDVDQWVSVARDAGMKYVVLTAKHHSGHCLWPSEHTDYHVGNSGDTTDVVEALVNACEKRGVLPGLYYASWDNHHRFGSVTPSDLGAAVAYTTKAYRDFQTAQLEELLTRYGKIAEVWVDIPQMLPRDYHRELYAEIADWQPDAVIMFNSGMTDGSKFPIEKAWPSDLISIERHLPPSATGHVKWREIRGDKYYMPGEVCDPLGQDWFYTDADQPRNDQELLGMYLATRGRGANLLLDVGPDRQGLIPSRSADALLRLRKNLDKLGF